MENMPTTFYRTSIKALILDESREKFVITLEDSGWWELPGGGLDFPEKPDECLRREIKEEMGLEVTWVDPFPSYFLVGKNTKGVQSVNVIFEVKVKDLNFTKSDECQEIRFVSGEEVETMNAFRNVKELGALFDKARHKK